MDILTRIGNGAEGEVHLATLRTTRAGIPVVLDVVAKVSFALCCLWYQCRQSYFAPCACIQAPFALLPESRDLYGVEPGSEGEKFIVDCFLREAKLQARLKHPYVTKVYAAPPVWCVFGPRCIFFLWMCMCTWSTPLFLSACLAPCRYGVREQAGVPTWIVMERALMSLDEYLTKLGPGGLEAPVLSHIMTCVFTALDHMHNCKDAEGHSTATIHYNVNPHNVLVFPSTGPDSPMELDFKMCDFGSSLDVSTVDPRGVYVSLVIICVRCLWAL